MIHHSRIKTLSLAEKEVQQQALGIVFSGM